MQGQSVRIRIDSTICCRCVQYLFHYHLFVELALGALHYGITLRIRGPNVVDTNHWGAAIDDRGLK
jgi:hypothetical protein